MDTSTLGLMFEISADPSKGIVAAQQFSEQVTAAMQQMAVELETVKAQLADTQVQLEALSTSHVRVGNTSKEAREAIRGMGEELGLHMPRFISSFITEIEGVGPALASAFSVVAIVGIVEMVAEQLPKAYDKLVEKITGWDKEAQAAYKNQIKENEDYIKILEEAYQVQLKIRHLSEEDVTKGTIAQKQQELLMYERTAVAARNDKQVLEDRLTLWGQLMGPVTGVTQQIADLGKVAEESQKKADELTKEIKRLTDVKLPEEQFKEQEQYIGLRDAATKASADLDKKESDEVLKNFQKNTREQLKTALDTMELFNSEQIKMSEGLLALQDTIAKGQTEVDAREGNLALKNFETRTKQELKIALDANEVIIADILKTNEKRSQLINKAYQADIAADREQYRRKSESHAEFLQRERQALDQWYQMQVATIGQSEALDEEYYRKKADLAGQAHAIENKYYEGVIGLLENLNQAHIKSHALQVALILERAAMRVIEETGEALSALAFGNGWAAAMHFASAAEFAVMGGLDAFSGGGSGGRGATSSSSRPGTLGSPSGATAGMVTPSQTQPVYVTVFGSQQELAQTIGDALNNHVRYNGGQLIASETKS